MIEQFKGKKVHLYPGDTTRRQATVLDINPAGVTFLMLSGSGVTEGDIRFIAYTANLSFTLAE